MTQAPGVAMAETVASIRVPVQTDWYSKGWLSSARVRQAMADTVNQHAYHYLNALAEAVEAYERVQGQEDGRR